MKLIKGILDLLMAAFITSAISESGTRRCDYIFHEPGENHRYSQSRKN